jgi:uncharacterized protein
MQPRSGPSTDAVRSSPTAASGRIAIIDALRGAAMLGIVLVNFPTMNTMAGDETAAYGGMHTDLDRWVGAANMALLNGKFYPIFALLFGLGLCLADRSGGPPPRLAARRLALLLGIGLLHLTLVWWGDILIVYAVLGLLVLPCRRWSPGNLLFAALVLLVLLPALTPLLGLLSGQGGAIAERVLLPGLGVALPSPEAAAATYAHGTFPEMLRQRALDYLSDFTPFAAGQVTLGLLVGYGKYYAQLLGLFLLGIWAGRQALHLRLGADRAWTLRAWWLLGPLAALLTALRFGLAGMDSTLSYPQGTALALAYVLAFALLLPAWPRARPVLEAVGRLSLTAYLSHTTLCSLLLYGTGLGLYGRIGPAALLPISLACYGLVAWGCIGWSRRFRIGPAEWVWRSLLHGRALPLRNR